MTTTTRDNYNTCNARIISLIISTGNKLLVIVVAVISDTETGTEGGGGRAGGGEGCLQVAVVHQPQQLLLGVTSYLPVRGLRRRLNPKSKEDQCLSPDGTPAFGFLKLGTPKNLDDKINLQFKKVSVYMINMMS